MSKLTVLVGAGASQALGLPGTNDVLRHLRQAEADLIAQDIIRLGGTTPYPPVFETVLALLRQHYDEPNFEHMMHALECLVSLVETDSDPKGRYQALELLFTNGLNNHARELSAIPYTPRLAIDYLIGWLCDLFEHASLAAIQDVRWPTYQSFWATLSQQFVLDIATFNYDTCIELALPEIDQGFRPVEGSLAQRFDGLSFHESTDSRLMHLHGSINFGKWNSKHGINQFAYEDNWHDVYYYPNARHAALSRSGAGTEPISQAGRHTIIGPVITGLQKPDKVLSVEPYASYYHTFTSCLRSCPRLLIVGYGFGDTYINQIIERMSRWHGAARRIACIDYTPSCGNNPNIRDFPLQNHRTVLPFLSRWAGSFQHVNELTLGFIPSNPWRDPGGRVMLDCAGLLARETQAEEIVSFLVS